MARLTLVALLFASTALVGCNSRGSGRHVDAGPMTGLHDAGRLTISPTRRIADLSSAETRELCQWVAGVLGGEDMCVQCSDSVEVCSGTIAECQAALDTIPSSCSLTVSWALDCIDCAAIATCQEIPPECVVVEG